MGQDYRGYEITGVNPNYVYARNGNVRAQFEVIPFDDVKGSGFGFVNVYDFLVGEKILYTDDYKIVVDTPSGSHSIEAVGGTIHGYTQS